MKVSVQQITLCALYRHLYLNAAGVIEILKSLKENQ